MSRFLDSLVQLIKDNNYNVIRVSEKTGDGKTETAELLRDNRCQNTYSVAKAFAMTAIGLLYDKGLLSVDEKITDIFADSLPDGIDEGWRTATVEHALLHSAGFEPGFLDIDVKDTMSFGKDYLTFMFSKPPVYTPGEKEIYTDAAYYLLSRVVSQKTGMCLDDFMWREMLCDMDFAEMAWSHCPMGYAIGATGLYIHSADMIKLGVLYRDGGVYEGRRYLSEDWVKLVLGKRYCFDWNDEGTLFYKGGMHGQKLMVCPGQGRVVAVQSFGADTNVLAEFTTEYKE